MLVVLGGGVGWFGVVVFRFVGLFLDGCVSYFGWFWVVVLGCVQPLTIEISIIIIGCSGLVVLFLLVLLSLGCFWVVLGGTFLIMWIVFGWSFVYFEWSWVVVLGCMQKVTIEISIVII